MLLYQLEYSTQPECELGDIISKLQMIVTIFYRWKGMNRVSKDLASAESDGGLE